MSKYSLIGVADVSHVQDTNTETVFRAGDWVIVVNPVGRDH